MPRLRKSLISALSVVSGNTPGGESEMDKYDKLNKGAEEEEASEAQFKQQLTTLVVSPLLQQSHEAIKKGLVALSLVLQVTHFTLMCVFVN
jgi:hypothetical protein